MIQLIGKNWFDMCIPSEINAQVKQAYSKVMSGEMEEKSITKMRLLQNQEQELIYWNNALIKDEVGQIKNYFVQESISLNESIRSINKVKDEFHLLAESMPQIVWVALPDGLNIYLNQQWVNYTGLSLEESYGNGWIKSFHPDDQKCIRCLAKCHCIILRILLNAECVKKWCLFLVVSSSSAA
jgi:PAS domain-containing protein